MKKSKRFLREAQSVPEVLVKKPQRGRPPTVNRGEISNRAYYWGQTFEREWEELQRALLSSKTEIEIKNALKESHSNLADDLAHLTPLILEVRKETTFPKTRKAQIKYFAESLAALGAVSLRRSRDICADVRKHPIHQIIRRDYFIECSCKYQGPAYRGSCPKCGTSKVSYTASLPIFDQ